MSVLYVVATPIGNLEDVTLRAIRVLGEAKLVLAEDTRRTRVLLMAHGIDARPVSMHAHNEMARVEKTLEILAGGGDVAVVSDAGTPLVSDPGQRLVAAAIRAGFEVQAVPGASALLSALTISGLSADRFLFVGFLPRKASARDQLLERLQSAPETLVFFESPQRLAGTLVRLAQWLGSRRACVARELTKLHEEVARGLLQELAERFADGTRGEVTLVVEGAPPKPPVSDIRQLDADICKRLAEGESCKDIAAELAPESGLSKRAIYARAIALK